MRSPKVLTYVLVSMLMSGLFAAPAWSGYKLHQASPDLYWGTIPGKADMLRLKSLGVKTLINVRTNPLRGHQRMAEKLGLKFVHIKTGVVLTPQEPELTKYLSLICDPENRPTYVFCTLGTDRTCYYVAAYRMAVDGWTAEQAKAELDAHGLKPWWPTFREYCDALRANQDVIHRVASTWQGPPAVRTPTDNVDPCTHMIGCKPRKSKPSMATRARYAALTALFKPLEGLFKGSVALKAKRNGHPTTMMSVHAEPATGGKPAPVMDTNPAPVTKTNPEPATGVNPAPVTSAIVEQVHNQ